MIIISILFTAVLLIVVVALLAVIFEQKRTIELHENTVPEVDPEQIRIQYELLRLTTALETVDLGIIIADPVGELTYENGRARGLLESNDSRALVRQAVLELLAEANAGKAARREVDLFGPPKATYLVRALPLRIEATDETAGAVVVVEDISERRRTEQVRRDFVTNISHELKTPVGALGLLAESLDEDTDPDTVLRFTRRIGDEVHRLARTIDDLLELSRIEFGDDLQLDDHPVGALVAEAMDRLEGAARSRNVTFEVSGDPDIVINADRRQIASALSNLLDNAIKYSPVGSTITVDMATEGPISTIAVIDEGDGIPTRDLDRVFERFYRVDRARSRETGGTGLGLAIVRHVANNHGGTVSVQSKEGYGSTFTLAIAARGGATAAPASATQLDARGTNQAITPSDPEVQT